MVQGRVAWTGAGESIPRALAKKAGSLWGLWATSMDFEVLGAAGSSWSWGMGKAGSGEGPWTS